MGYFHVFQPPGARIRYGAVCGAPVHSKSLTNPVFCAILLPRDHPEFIFGECCLKKNNTLESVL